MHMEGRREPLTSTLVQTDATDCGLFLPKLVGQLHCRMSSSKSVSLGRSILGGLVAVDERARSWAAVEVGRSVGRLEAVEGRWLTAKEGERRGEKEVVDCDEGEERERKKWRGKLCLRSRWQGSNFGART